MPEAITSSNDKPDTEQVPLPTQEERDRAMADKYRNQLDGQVEPLAEERNEAAKPERPPHVPEKFWDAEKGEVRLEELTKSYAELEKKSSQPKPKGDGKSAEGADGTENGESGEGEPGSDDGKPDPVAEAVKSFNALREQATARLANGEELTDEMYAGFEKHGVTREDVNELLEGRKARAELARIQVFNEVGGEKQYGAMIEWARSNFEPAEIEVYDRDIHSADPAVRLTAARGLAARYAQAMGSDGKSVTDGRATSTAGGYASGAEMRADMRDPRYKTDEAFRKEVERKAVAARRAGVDLSM